MTTKNVKYWDYLCDYAARKDDYLCAVDEVFSSGQLILGAQVALFEERFAEFCGVAFGVGVNSGTDALFLALKGLGVGAGDEVITVANTAVPTVAAIRATGATPVFADVEEGTSLLDVNLLPAILTERTRCIVPVHLFGQMVDMEPLLEFARAKSLLVVEDCAQACGATYKGRRAGSFGNIGAFSFYPTKILGAFGDGGMMITASEDLMVKLRRLRNYGMEAEYCSDMEGYNSRLDEIQAALLNRRLPRVDAAAEKRREIAKIYADGLKDIGDISLPVVRKECCHQYNLYTIRTAFRDRLMIYLREQGVETKINYPTPIHLMRGYDFLGYRAGDLAVTESLCKRVLSLPIYPELEETDLLSVINSVKKFFSLSGSI